MLHHMDTTSASSSLISPLFSLCTGNTWTAEQEAAFKQPILTKYEKESHAFYSSARLWDDGIIDPADTRKVRVIVV